MDSSHWYHTTQKQREFKESTVLLLSALNLPHTVRSHRTNTEPTRFQCCPGSGCATVKEGKSPSKEDWFKLWYTHIIKNWADF